MAYHPHSMEQFFKLIGVIMRILIILFLIITQLLAIGNNNTDYQSLVSFKHQLISKQHSSTAGSNIFMSSWKENDKHFCSWVGISCGQKHSDRVTALDLRSCGLVGPLPPSIVNLTFLRRLDLSSNNLYGEVSPKFSHLQRLQYLNLSFNSFHGDFPAILMTNNSKLYVLDLSNNLLTGRIPQVINSVSQLNFLSIDKNHISGTIPPSIGNLSFLNTLFLLENHLEGSIPLEIGSLHELKYFKAAANNLSGDIPSSFYNISSLRKISLAVNNLCGQISVDIAKAFPFLEIFYIGTNYFTGSLNHAFQNVTSLVHLDLSRNHFVGVVPPKLGQMSNLIVLGLGLNELEASDVRDWRFFDSLINCTKLEMLGIDHNNFGGILPKSIRNLSIELQELELGTNYISGSLPFELGRYTNLIALVMDTNLLEGPIPESIGMLGSLQNLFLEDNNLIGSIPHSLSNLTRLSELWLGYNYLTGSIPSSLQNLQILNILDLSNNNLTGLIPRELFLTTALSNILDLSFNFFTGTLPSEVGNLINIIILDFSNNKLTAKLLESIGSCQLLVELHMEYNFFNGSIPPISNMKNLQILDLSHNNLSGNSPQSLQNLTSLKHLNLSFNNLEGEVPYEGIFANSTAILLVGNEKLCGGIPKLNLQKCVSRSSSIRKDDHLIKILILIFGVLIVLSVQLVCYIWLYKIRKRSDQRRNSSDLSLSTPFPRISYAKLAKATNGFSTSYLIGYGKYGSVYRGTLRDYQATMAIKVFNLEVHGAFKSFTSECDALRSIRHLNLVKILTSCSSIDLKGKDFKALIFEFMPKGNLDMWLHKEYEVDGDDALSIEERLNIIINIADALEYLHHSCEPSIIHCDIKPSNILLDNNMIAHIGDFGFSRIFSEALSMSLQDHSDKSEIKGTIGYVAPEYGGGAHPSTAIDVYSFGIMTLEIITGRRPTDDIFKDNLNLHNHVKMAFPHRINSIKDPKMFTKDQREVDYSSWQWINKCLMSLAEVGLSCSTSLPDERPMMREVVTKLHMIRTSYLKSARNREFS